MRRVLALASGVVFIELLFFSILSPLLPGYVDDLGLSKAQAGVLAGAYAWGSFAAALPAGFLVQRFGPRAIVCVGLVAISAANITIGWASHIVILDLARFAQGISGAVVWSGGMTWLIAAAPGDEKGSATGTAIGVGGVGGLLGPALGALASLVGTGWIFTATLLLTGPLFFAALRTPEPHSFTHQPVRAVVSATLTGPVMNAIVLLTIPSIAFGLVTVLVPLKVNDLGGSAVLIALAFIGSAVIEATLGRMSGTWSDRAGRQAPYMFGLVIFCVGLVVQGATQSLSLVVGFFLIGTVGAGFLISPAFTNFSDASEQSGLALAHAIALSNTAMSFGLAIGTLFGGALASVTGTTSPYLVVAGFLLLLALRARRLLTGKLAVHP
jgi:MFS family permease